MKFTEKTLEKINKVYAEKNPSTYLNDYKKIKTFTNNIVSLPVASASRANGTDISDLIVVQNLVNFGNNTIDSSTIGTFPFNYSVTDPINNKTVTETELLKFIINNEDLNLNKIINSCLNGETKECLFYFEKIYEKSNSNIILIRMFRKHFKTIEKILLSNQRGNSFLEAINDLKPPIFFKEKPFFLSQCKLWSLKKINLVQKRLIDLELKTKIGLYPEKTLLSQFILSSSVLAKQKVKT